MNAEQGTIVILDEDRRFARQLGLSFEADGWEVLTARDQAEGLTIFYHHRPCIVVLGDLVFGSGKRYVLEQICSLCQAAIVLVSESDSVQDTDQWLNWGANVCLPRSLGVDELSVKLREFLHRPAPPPARSREAHPNHLEEHLAVLKPQHVIEIDEALFTIGPFGEVRIIKDRGHIKFIQKVDTRSVRRYP